MIGTARLPSKRVAALGVVVLLIGLTGCAEAVQSSDTEGATSTTTVPAPTTTVPTPTTTTAPTQTTLDPVEVMAKIGQLFGSGDLFGVEVSLHPSGDIAVYSLDLTPEQKQRIEETLGEVTYHPEVIRCGPGVVGPSRSNRS